MYSLDKKALTWQQFDDLFQFFLESNLKNSIGFINNQTLQIFIHEARSVLQQPIERKKNRQGELTGDQVMYPLGPGVDILVQPKVFI